MPTDAIPRFDLDTADTPFRRLDQQADLTYHAAPVRGIFNPPSATGMGFWSINPYVGCAFGCAYCYARDTHKWTLERAGEVGTRIAESMPSWLAFERRVLVKENAAQRVREALATSRSPKPGESIVIGSATDPYQPAERRFRVTRQILEALTATRGLRITIITKSPLVTRDVDVLARLTQRGRLGVHITITTIDRELARRLEPRAPTPEARLRAVRRLADAGIEVSVNCMPVLPGITDDPRALSELVARVADAGATHVAACALRLRAASKRRYLPFVRESFPALAASYERTYRHSAYAGERYRKGLAAFIDRLCHQHGLPARSGTYDETEAEEAVGPSEANGQLEFLLHDNDASNHAE
ncbi:MAG: radical SAM protein [Gemmatimonadaceae bacterium]|nr:radical SAM protein [Gemmatimonadaceae bacterium]